MKKLLLTFLALSLSAAAHAQTITATMIGVPEYGVELTGTAEVPVVTNHSGKRIIAYAVKFVDVNAAPHEAVSLFMHQQGFQSESSKVANGVFLGEVPAASPVIPAGLTPAPLSTATKVPIAVVSLDAVVFDTMQLVGSDTDNNFEKLSRAFEGYRAVGQHVMADKTQAWQDFEAMLFTKETKDQIKHGNKPQSWNGCPCRAWNRESHSQPHAAGLIN